MTLNKQPLEHREEAAELLKELDRTVARPIAAKFGLTYSLIAEQHPQASKAGMTYRATLSASKQITVIRVRVRSRTDAQGIFFPRGTLYAVLLHELAHLREMNHGIEFAKFLREVYRFADALGIFSHPDSKCNMLPSPWPWENLLFKTRGLISEEDVVVAFQLPRIPKGQGPTIVESDKLV